MRDFIRLFLVGVIFFFSTFANAENVEKKAVLVLPDNIVTAGTYVDSYIYDATAEFFANEIITILNKTDYIKSPNVSEERNLIKSKPAYINAAKNLMGNFKVNYNIDYAQLNKVAKINKQQYVLLLTSSIDHQNYVLRRTFWDFLNIAGATVIDPAYKISTYAVLVDTKNNSVLWSNTFYKTISVVENRIITTGPSPQTEQLQKIRDYSRMLCPEIAQNIQINILTGMEYEKESHKIYYDMANFDNVFTKKYRRWNREGKKDYNAFKSSTGYKIDKAKENIQDFNENRKVNKAKKEQARQIRQEAQMEVKAEQYIEPSEGTEPNQNKIKNKNKDNATKIIQPMDMEEESIYEPIYFRKHWRNRLLGDYDSDRPELRDYDKL